MSNSEGPTLNNTSNINNPPLAPIQPANNASNQYQTKRKFNTQRNKLVKQIEAEEFDFDEAQETITELLEKDETIPFKQDELIRETAPTIVTPLTNILEDDEETTLLASNEPVTFNNKQPVMPISNAASRRSSRGTENTISTLTILEEVETDSLNMSSTLPNNLTLKPDSLNQHLHQQQQSQQQLTNSNIAQSEEFDEDLNNEQVQTQAQTQAIKKKLITPNNRISASSGAETSSDNSDTEFKLNHLNHHQMKQDLAALNYDWNRSASSSARSRNKYRQQSNNQIKSLSEQQQRSRPLSISSETNDLNQQSSNDMFKLPIFHNELLNNTKEGTSSSGCINTVSSPSYKQMYSYQANSNDQLQSSGTPGLGLISMLANSSKALSIEHRLANMSQISINSQLSKNNSIRHHSRPGVCDTPNNLLQQPSTTPTPRESIVFNRGDEKPPIAKILLNQSGVVSSGNKFQSLSGSTEQQIFQESKRCSMQTNHGRTSNEHEEEHLQSKKVKNNVEIMLQTKVDNFIATNNNNNNSIVRQNNQSYSLAISSLPIISNTLGEANLDEPKQIEKSKTFSLKSNKSANHEEKSSSLKSKRSKKHSSEGSVNALPAKNCTKCCTII